MINIKITIKNLSINYIKRGNGKTVLILPGWGTTINTYMPLINHNEIKTKMTQHSVKTLMQYGIQPDFLVCRVMDKWDVSQEEENSVKQKISNFCNVESDRVIINRNVDSIYDLVGSLNQQNFVEYLFDFFRVNNVIGSYIPSSTGIRIALSSAVEKWEETTRASIPVKPINVVIAGKYVKVGDAYLSVIEAIKHAASSLNKCVEIELLDTEGITKDDLCKIKMDACIIPGGFGSRGIEGMITVAKYCRINKIPCLGICLGMQIMAVEFARNKVFEYDATSTEWNPDAPKNKQVIINMAEYTGDEQMGGTMRLGSYKNKVVSERLRSIYSFQDTIEERHRHRYEFNSKEFKEKFSDKGLDTMAEYQKGDITLTEVIGIENEKFHPFYIGCQFHPELKSRPERPHPLFIELLSKTSR